MPKLKRGARFLVASHLKTIAEVKRRLNDRETGPPLRCKGDVAALQMAIADPVMPLRHQVQSGTRRPFLSLTESRLGGTP
jgi:hypothetical protein